jgi:DMSO/TMAO reductase YedYZ molybdopterin-dependent catalytic subunit
VDVFDFLRGKPRLPPELAARVPPGQYNTEKWPVLHYGGVPRISAETWSLSVYGALDGEQIVLSYADLLKLPQTSITVDIHCVTRWSRLDTQFDGVRFTDVLSLVRPSSVATHALIHAAAGYAANLALDDLQRPEVLLAHRADGKDLEAEHGGPVRLVVPHLYFWKSAKWVQGVELTNEERPGFWESYGYHMRGDPWAEQRYSDD